MNELQKRIIVAVIGIPIAFLVVYFGGIVFTLAIALISSLALNEFYNMVEKKGYPTFKIFGIILGLLPFLLNLIKDFLNLKFNLLVMIFVIPFLVTVALLLALFSKKTNIIATVGGIFTGFFYISCSFFALVLIRKEEFILHFEGNENFGLFIVIIMFCSIWVCDSAAYFIGRKFGKHKLLERVSPKKSIEGAIAGFIAATIFFPFATHFLLPNFSIIFSLLLGITVGIFGQIGDLIESKFKRDAEIKDSSNLIPGHGGILDRFDSIIFVSPLVLIILVIFNLLK